MSRMGLLELPDGGQLRYDEAGDGPAVLLLHPGLWDRRTWDDQMTSFPASGYRTIRYDQRGYGESSRLTGEPYSRVVDLLAILDHLDVGAGRAGRRVDGRDARDRRDPGASLAGVGPGGRRGGLQRLRAAPGRRRLVGRIGAGHR